MGIIISVLVLFFFSFRQTLITNKLCKTIMSGLKSNTNYVCLVCTVYRPNVHKTRSQMLHKFTWPKSLILNKITGSFIVVKFYCRLQADILFVGSNILIPFPSYGRSDHDLGKEIHRSEKTNNIFVLICHSSKISTSWNGWAGGSMLIRLSHLVCSSSTCYKWEWWLYVCSYGTYKICLEKRP